LAKNGLYGLTASSDCFKPILLSLDLLSSLTMTQDEAGVGLISPPS